MLELCQNNFMKITAEFISNNLESFSQYWAMKNGWTEAERRQSIKSFEVAERDGTYATIDNIINAFDCTKDDCRYYKKRLSFKTNNITKPLKINLDKLSQFVVLKRQKKIWTKTQFAKAVGITIDTVTALENVGGKRIRHSTISGICDYFNISVQDINEFNQKVKIVSPYHLSVFLKSKRQMANSNQTDFANELGLSQGMLSKLELGKNNFEVRTLKKICDYFGCSANDIVNYKHEEELSLSIQDISLFIISMRYINQWSVRGMKAKTGLNEKTVRDLESFQAAKISTGVLDRICNTFNVNTQEIAKQGDVIRKWKCPILAFPETLIKYPCLA